MRPTLRLGSFAGIDVGLHWSVAIMAGMLTATLAGTILPTAAPGYTSLAYLVVALATAGLFLLALIVHELGHSVVAEASGARVRGITLFALGGVALIDREPRSPRSAAAIALAGPAASIAVGVGSLVSAWVAATVGMPLLVSTGLVWLGAINLMLAGFNLLPALPLDGGRVVQAALWHCHGDRHRATITAARIGRWLGGVLIATGLWQILVFHAGIAGLWTVAIGGFIVLTARAEALRAHLARHQTPRPAPLR